MCNGQVLPISQNTALFSLLGTTYGGNGQATFALPNLMGRAPMQAGQGPGMSLYFQGDATGTTSVTLLSTEMPQHSHAMGAATLPASAATPTTASVPSRSTGGSAYGPAGSPTQLSPQTLAIAGGNQPHNNMMPYLALNFCIALQGIFPARN